MGIFGFFGKKSGRKESGEHRKEAAASRQPTGQQQPPVAGPDGLPSEPDGRERMANVARASATARKIDAIESEMSSELRPPREAQSSPVPAQRPSPFNDNPRPGKHPAQVPVSFESTLPSLGMSTEFLLGVEGKAIPVPIEIVGSETAQVIEEAAILFANGQSALVEDMLRAAIADGKPEQATKDIWWMLFDLYQITGQQQQFEALSIDYASRFETSPPSWVKPEPAGCGGTSPFRASVPAVSFSGKLDAGIIKLLERAMKLGQNSPVLRLEFARVTEVAPVGCGLLLRTLKKLQDSGHELVLVGAAELAGRIRAILQVGRRDETEAPWLLLLEILRLLRREKEFEETSIDYCVTFEVSPPAYSAPGGKITAASTEAGAARDPEGGFAMPAVVEGPAEQLMEAVAAFAAGRDPVALDCSRLDRIDFSAAGQLLGCLAPLAASGRKIEFHGVNYLVAALFTVIGLRDIARVLPRKS